MKRLALFALLALAALAAAARAEYPAPEAAGFHHCALIYGRDTRTAADLAPYVAYDRQPAWLFDAFLFLHQGPPSGESTEGGKTTQADWQWLIDTWFSPGRDVPALDEAITAAARRLGPPPAPRKVMFAIPFPSPENHAFGPVDGRMLDFARPEDRQAAVRWYTTEIRRRFEAARFRHLALWGFYWMREDMPQDEIPMVRDVSRIIHDAGGRFLWIPYHAAEGNIRWKEAGIDVAILQPNYAFSTWQHGGSVGRNRLALTADIARRNGMGVEMECFNIDQAASDRRAFTQYLSEGRPARFGYQRGASAYYLETEQVERVSRAKDPAVRAIYDTLARYVRNIPVPDPDPPLRWTVTKRAGATVAEARWKGARPVALANVYLSAIDGGWRGRIEASVRRPGATKYSPAGWAIRSGDSPSSGAFQGQSVPIGGAATAIRLVFRPSYPCGDLRITGFDLDPNDVPGRILNRAAGRTYAMDDRSTGQYPDPGGLLTDGAVGGFQEKRAAGWFGGGDVAVCFDLGARKAVSRAEVVCQGGGFSAVNWPDSAMALFSPDTPVMERQGRGAPPAGFACVPGGPVAVDATRGPADSLGRVAFVPARPLTARYVTFILRPNSWLMLSEARITAGGANIAPKASYVLRPGPTAGGGRYSDDGVRLTDGLVATGFDPGLLDGWQGAAPKAVTVDMGGITRVRSATAHSLAGGRHGITAPREVRVDTSVDGGKWMPLGEWRKPVPESGTDLRPLECRVTAQRPIRARYVRFTITGRGEWTMLSEAEVR